VLLVAHLLVLAFPLGGVVLLRLYESVLVRRTESELLVQGAVLAAAYRASLRQTQVSPSVTVQGSRRTENVTNGTKAGFPAAARSAVIGGEPRKTALFRGEGGWDIPPEEQRSAVIGGEPRKTAVIRGEGGWDIPPERVPPSDDQRYAGRPLLGLSRFWAGRRFRPVLPTLDLSRDDVLPQAGPARLPRVPPAPEALVAGARLQEVLAHVQRSTLAGIRILDWHGNVVASTGGELGLSLAHRREVARALHGSRVSLMRHRPQRHPPPGPGSLRRGAFLRVFVALPVIQGRRVVGAVVLSRTPPSVWQTLQRRGTLLLGASLALLALIVLLVSLTSWTISRPMRALTRQAERIRRGDRRALAELSRPGTREVRQLSRALIQMARTLDERAAYIQTFAANVSHEFKTPLAAIRGTVELLRDHLPEMSEAERARFLSNLAGDAERLERLVRGLLDLARADTIRPDAERCDVVAVVRAVVQRFVERGLAVNVGYAPEHPVEASMASATLESVLASLLDNARQHGGDDVNVAVRVEVRVGRGAGGAAWRDEGHPAAEAAAAADTGADSGAAVGPEEQWVAIQVVDDGPGISPANRPRVFERFFTTAREQGGSGLGLAVVKAQVEAHGGHAACRAPETGTGAHLTVVLPLASAEPTGLESESKSKSKSESKSKSPGSESESKSKSPGSESESKSKSPGSESESEPESEPESPGSESEPESGKGSKSESAPG
jgi:signal transduction histidine kinase